MIAIHASARHRLDVNAGVCLACARARCNSIRGSRQISDAVAGEGT